MKVTQQKISINNVNEINKDVIDVAFGNGCNAASGVVIPRNPHNKNKTKIGTWNVRTMGANEKVKKEKMANIVREMKLNGRRVEIAMSKDIVLSPLVEEEESME